MLNYRSPIINNMGYPNGYPVNFSMGYNTTQNTGYPNNYYGGNYYGNYGYNPLQLAKQREEEEKAKKEKLQSDLNIMKGLYKVARKVKGEDYNEAVVDKFYDAESYREQPKPKKSRKRIKVIVARSDTEVIEAPNNTRADEYELGYFAIQAKRHEDNIIDKVTQQVLNGTAGKDTEAFYQQQFAKIHAEHDKIIDPNADLVEFFENAYKLYIEGLKHKSIEQQRQLNTLYNKEQFVNSLYTEEQKRFAQIMNGSYNVDDDSIHLPPNLSMQQNYAERKRKFLEAAMRRG